MPLLKDALCDTNGHTLVKMLTGEQGQS